MKNKAKNIAIAAVIVSMATTSVSAFDIKLIGSAQQAQTWSLPPNNTQNAHTRDTTNIGVSVGHYKNNNLEGFGFGWHVGVSTPSNFDYNEGGTVEIGIAPGYSITKELAVKVDLGVGLKNGMTSGIRSSSGYYEEQEMYAAYIYGLSVEYVISDNYVIGGAAKMWTYTFGNGIDNAESDATFIPELSIGYRF